MSYREVYDRWLADPEGWWLDAARTIDWDRYVPEVHLPSVVKAARAPTRPPTRGGQSRSEGRVGEWRGYRVSATGNLAVGTKLIPGPSAPKRPQNRQ